MPIAGPSGLSTASLLKAFAPRRVSWPQSGCTPVAVPKGCFHPEFVTDLLTNMQRSPLVLPTILLDLTSRTSHILAQTVINLVSLFLLCYF